MRDDGTTNLKLEALPKLVTFIHFSKMTMLYNGIRPKLNVDRLAGTTSYCLGFTKERKIRYVAKGVSLNKINLPDELCKLIDLSDFQEK